MIVEEIRVDIARPIDEVFVFLTDAHNHPRWDTGSLEMEPDEPGPWHTGLGFREVRKIGPREITIRSRIASLDAPMSMDIESVTGPPFTGQWRLSPQDGGTRLHWTGRMELRGPQRLLGPLIGRAFRRSTHANFDRLKRLLETSPTSA